MHKVVHELSPTSKGIGKVEALLAEYGIKFFMLKHLKGTYLDGAVFFDKNHPVVVLTGRYDRTDNFWFTLLHELSHIACGHLTESTVIFDDLDIVSQDKIEQDADSLAQSIAINEDAWRELIESKYSHADIFDFAIIHRLSPAIVAGRIRFQTKNYRAFTSLIGHGEVRKHFPKVFFEG